MANLAFPHHANNNVYHTLSTHADDIMRLTPPLELRCRASGTAASASRSRRGGASGRASASPAPGRPTPRPADEEAGAVSAPPGRARGPVGVAARPPKESSQSSHVAARDAFTHSVERG